MGDFGERQARNALAVTRESGKAYLCEAKCELVSLAVVGTVAQHAFRDPERDRDRRFVRLVRTVAVEDGEWTARFVRWLRAEARLRGAALVAAAESAFARREAGLHGTTRETVDSACQRADDPGELLSYWTRRYGRALPKPVKRGLADAVRRLYGERALLQQDTGAHGFRFADVLQLVHPAPDRHKPWQGALFQRVLDRRRPGPVGERTAGERAAPCEAGRRRGPGSGGPARRPRTVRYR